MNWRAALLLVGIVLTGCATTTRPGVVGVERSQLMLVSPAEVQHMGNLDFANQYNKAKAQGRLVMDGYTLERLRKIAGRLIGQTATFRGDAQSWNWQIMLINANILNATCGPGGKITFYTGLIQRLSLSDDEIAAIMGHEIAHALREHAREQVSEAMAQNLLTNIALALTRDKETQIAVANQMAVYLYKLPHSRANESEADKIGVELAARSGYDPRGALSVWRKMAGLSGSSPPEFLSTHPSYPTRYSELSALIPKVVPLYEAAAKP